MMMNALTGGVRTAGSLVARGGVNPHLGGGLAVTAQGSPSLALNVASGMVIVPGSEGTRQGVYVCVNDATRVVTMDAAHATLPRIDLVVARVYDSFYSGASNTWALEKVTGTANSSPVAPALPANSLLVATVNRSAADDTIANGDITDNRVNLVATGGVIPVHSSGKTALLNQVGNGQLSVETDTGRIAAVIGGAWAGATTLDVQVFTANGTWTKPSGARTVRVIVVGGGGAGGGAPSTAAGESSCGSGGQSGAYAESYLAASALAGTVAVTRGAGGAAVSGAAGNAGAQSSFGAHVVAPGGAAGTIAAASSGGGGTLGGQGSQSMTGTIQVQGQAGGGCMRVASNAALGGTGGSNPLGAGGAGGASPSGPAAVAGTGYGAGGGGAANGQSSSNRIGGAGANGIIIAISFL